MKVDETLEKIIQDPEFIKYVPNPSEIYQLAAVKKDPLAIRYIQNPVESAQLLVVNLYPRLLDQIKNPTKKVVLEAFRYMLAYYSEFNFWRNLNDPLIQSFHSKSKMHFFIHVPAYKNELQNTTYFKEILFFLLEHFGDWTKEFIQVLSPLTKEQEDIWKQHRLRTLL